jgi:RimJ/RimL family protein N-acetyltransferase
VKVRLRPWDVADAGALAAAWRDPEVRRWTAVPEDTSEAAAVRWIEGWEARARSGVALDLVVSPLAGDEVLGEVGFVRDGTVARCGWWVVAAHRGQGVASEAVALLAARARALGLDPVADVDGANAASIRVAERAGIAVVREAKR